MANDLNRCEFIGRLGRDPETRHSPDGTAVCNFSIACGWKTKDKEGTEWVRIVAFGKLAEICGQYLTKGKQIFVSGRMATRKWQDKDTGADRYSTEIVADQMQMLGGREGGGEGGYGGGGGGYDEAPQRQQRAPAPQRPAQQQQPRQAPAPAGGANLADMDDDIPF